MAPPSGAVADGAGRDGRLDFGEVVIDLGGREVFVDSHPIGLTRTQFDLLVALASAPGRVVRRDELMEQVWGHTFFADPDHLSVHIHHIRRALGDGIDPPRYIQTVRGVGYKFIAVPKSLRRHVIIDFDGDSVVRSVSPHAPFLGWHPEDIVGKYFSLAGLDPDSSRMALEQLAPIGILASPIPIVDGDGVARTVVVTVTVNVEDGLITGYRGVIELPD